MIQNLTRMTTSISSEAQKLLIDIWKKLTIEQCHKKNIKLIITKPLKSRNQKSTASNRYIKIKLCDNLQNVNSFNHLKFQSTIFNWNRENDENQKNLGLDLGLDQ